MQPGTNTVYFTGGECYDPTPGSRMTWLTFSYNFDDGTWSNHNDMTVNRIGHAMKFTPDGSQIIIAGGKFSNSLYVNMSFRTWARCVSVPLT